MWTEDICYDDSDGDGYTNGEELGDPDCLWEVGHVPSRIVNITHPGNSTQTHVMELVEVCVIQS